MAAHHVGHGVGVDEVDQPLHAIEPRLPEADIAPAPIEHVPGEQDTSVAVIEGAFGNDNAASVADIKDGASNTILVGEATQQRNTSVAFGPYWGAGVHTCCHGRTSSSVAVSPCGTQNPLTGIRYGAINFDNNCNGTNQQYAWQFGSFHSGGAQFVFADGSVKFISQSVDYFNVFLWLNRINDGKNPGSDY